MVAGVLLFWPGGHRRASKASRETSATSRETSTISREKSVASSSGSTSSANTSSYPTNTSSDTDTHPDKTTDNTHLSNETNTGTHPTAAAGANTTTDSLSAPGYANPNEGSSHNRETSHKPATSHNLTDRGLTRHTAGHPLTRRTTSHNLASRTPNHTDEPNRSADHTRSPNPTRTSDPTRRWTTSTTKLASTNQPAPKFIRAADSLLRAIRSGDTTAKTTPKKKNKATGLGLAAGVSLGQSIPIGQQQLSSYNLLADYIPSPYLRLYVGDRWYLQTTPHLLSAQYTPSQLIDSSGGDTSRIPGYPQYLQYNKITLKKLYYTDIPLTINYRLFKGLYLGAGIQYSRLWQAAGEDRITLRPSNGLGSDTLFSTKTIGLKNNDSAFNKLARSDWRLLLQADYIWRRFTFGLQYQRGLNTYLPTNPSGSKGTDRNSSFSIHVYYEIWNQRPYPRRRTSH